MSFESSSVEVVAKYRAYFLLMKPGIIMGNLITLSSAFVFASGGAIDWALFCANVLGLSLVMASACVLNNYIDREADAKMVRTCNRALVQGVVSVPSALGYASILGGMGFSILSFYTNWLATVVAAAGFVIYVGLYSFWKYRSAWAVWVGSFAGATPPVVGYCAACGRIDIAALSLFAMLIFWQMPHFYAIALFRQKDYAAARIPTMVVLKERAVLKAHMVLYVLAFTVAALSLGFLGGMHWGYVGVVSLFAMGWIRVAIKGFWAADEIIWARQMFLVSLLVIIAVSCALSTLYQSQ